jgi:hypothetical protein
VLSNLVGPVPPLRCCIDLPSLKFCDFVTRQYPTDMITDDGEAQQLLKLRLQFVRECSRAKDSAIVTSSSRRFFDEATGSWHTPYSDQSRMPSTPRLSRFAGG